MKMGQNSFTNGCIMNVPKILFREFTGCKDGVRVLILHSDTSILQREIPCDQSHDSLPSGPPLVCMFNNQGATKWPLFWYTFCCIGGFGWILGVDFFLGYFAYQKSQVFYTRDGAFPSKSGDQRSIWSLRHGWLRPETVWESSASPGGSAMRHQYVALGGI